MSGSSGGIGGVRTPQPNNCESLAFETNLSSPKQAVVGQLQLGDQLEVGTKDSGNTTAVVAMHNQEVAGGLASPLIQQLRECLSNGHLFTAEVIDIQGGQVLVRVESAGP
jgi:hypothetical protein